MAVSPLQAIIGWAMAYVAGIFGGLALGINFAMRPRVAKWLREKP